MFCCLLLLLRPEWALAACSRVSATAIFLSSNHPPDSCAEEVWRESLFLPPQVALTSVEPTLQATMHSTGVRACGHLGQVARCVVECYPHAWCVGKMACHPSQAIQHHHHHKTPLFNQQLCGLQHPGVAAQADLGLLPFFFCCCCFCTPPSRCCFFCRFTAAAFLPAFPALLPLLPAVAATACWRRGGLPAAAAAAGAGALSSSSISESGSSSNRCLRSSCCCLCWPSRRRLRICSRFLSRCFVMCSIQSGTCCDDNNAINSSSSSRNDSITHVTTQPAAHNKCPQPKRLVLADCFVGSRQIVSIRSFNVTASL